MKTLEKTPPTLPAETDVPSVRKLLTEKDTAKYLGVSRGFLRKSRMTGPLRGQTPAPPWVQFGRSIRYDLDDLNQWISAHRCDRQPLNGGAS